jgi:hypothetical protein
MKILEMVYVLIVCERRTDEETNEWTGVVFTLGFFPSSKRPNKENSPEILSRRRVSNHLLTQYLPGELQLTRRDSQQFR